jgi:1,2-diacylglycerol 3-alpha-glucosyltransferase
VSSENIYDYFEASDLVIFPGRHSVLWEQAVGQGKPCIFKYYPGHTHIDLGGNCKYLYEASAIEIEKVIQECMDSFESLNKNAEEKGPLHFSYYNIAKRSIE